jgi:hypothetical protein
MHASVRVYRVSPARMREFDETVRREFVPLVRQASGFVAYYGVDGGNGKWMSISVFETEAQARATDTLAAQFVGARLLPMIERGPELTHGEVVASALAAPPE